MNKEIELKARVNDPVEMRSMMDKLYGGGKDISKEDIYYLYGNIPGQSSEDRSQPVRLRTENDENVVTLKRKSVDDGIEMNDELEFGVDDQQAFLKFLQLTGASEWLVKTKRGWKYSAEVNGFKAVIELCEVSTLGWFLEIEIVLSSPNDEQAAAAKDTLYNILNKAGLSERDIESRYYSDMLR